MDRFALTGALTILAVLGLSQAVASCSCSAPAPDAITAPAPSRGAVATYARVPAPVLATVEPPRADLDVPDTCRQLVYRGPSGERRIGKTKAPWLRNAAESERKRAELRELIFIVADELGVDELAAEMIWRKAIYESSGDASNVHLLNPDVKANRIAAAKGKRRSSERWRNAEVLVYEDVGGQLMPADQVDAWAFGRGLYGQVTGLHLHRWSTDAPPWSLCDPVIATVTTIWAMRAGLDECHGSTLRDAYRRFSSGKCAVRSRELERRFDRLAGGRVRGLRLDAFDPDARADLGTRWDEATTDRAILLGVLRERLHRDG